MTASVDCLESFTNFSLDIWELQEVDRLSSELKRGHQVAPNTDLELFPRKNRSTATRLLGGELNHATALRVNITSEASLSFSQIHFVNTLKTRLLYNTDDLRTILYL